LREHIWLRQVDSFTGDLARLYAWVILLNYAPSFWPFRGKADGLLARTELEWAKLRPQVNAGNPVPLMLVRDTAHAFENHQVLATGYEQFDQNHNLIYLYDPNCPGIESTIDFEFGAEQLRAQESCSAGHPLLGFFCETYTPHDPPEIAE
jgi:hypothetical protein